MRRRLIARLHASPALGPLLLAFGLAVALPPPLALAQSSLGGFGQALPPPRPLDAAPPAAPSVPSGAPSRPAAPPPAAPPAAVPAARPPQAPPRPPAASAAGAAPGPAPSRAPPAGASARDGAAAAPQAAPRPSAPQPSRGAAPGSPAPAAGARPPAAAATGGVAAGAAAGAAAAPRPPEAAVAPPESPPTWQTGPVTGLPLPRFAALRSDQVNLRAGPGTRYPIEWTFQRRDWPVEILREHDVWRRIRDVDGTEGWVHVSTLTARRSFLVRGGEERLLRRSPDAEAAPVARLRPGVIGRLRRCEADSPWCEVQVGAHRGWIRRGEIWGVGPAEEVK